MLRQLKPNGSFYYQFILDGKRYNGVCKNCTTKKDAEAYERKIKREAARGDGQTEAEQYHRVELKKILRSKNQILLDDALALAEKKPRKRIPSTKKLELKRGVWRDFLTFMHGEYPDITNLADVEKKHAEAYISQLRQKGKYDKVVQYSRSAKRKRKSIKQTVAYRRQEDEQLSPRTVNFYQVTCAEVFTLLREDAELQSNPFSSIPKLDVKDETRDAFTPEELKLIYDNLDDFTRPLFMMAVWTGLREGDICTLKWREVDLERRLITRKTRKTGAIVQIPISDQLYDLIVAAPRTKSEFVFPKHAEMYMTNGCGVSYRIKQFLERLGIETTRVPEGRTRAISVKDLHSCRHTFCYYAGVAGIPLAVVQAIVGHMSPEMTKHYQAHATLEDKRRGMERLSFFKTEALPAASEAPERVELRQMIEALPIEKVRTMLRTLKAQETEI